MYIIIEVSDMQFRIDWEDIVSPNIFSAIDPDKPPIKNIIDPAAFGLLFITVFRFNIDHFLILILWFVNKVYKCCEYYLKKGNRINV